MLFAKKFRLLAPFERPIKRTAGSVSPPARGAMKPLYPK